MGAAKKNRIPSHLLPQTVQRDRSSWFHWYPWSKKQTPSPLDRFSPTLQLGRSLLGYRCWLRTATGTKNHRTNGWLHFYSANVNRSHQGKYPPSHHILADMRQQIKLGWLKLTLTRLMQAAGHKYNHINVICYKIVGWNLCPLTHWLRSRSSVLDLASSMLQKVFTSMAFQPPILIPCHKTIKHST